MAKALRRSTTGAGYQDIKSPDVLETDLLQVNTTMVAPAGTSFPGSPTDGEWFWKSDTNILYRYNAGAPAWEPVVAGSIYGAKSGIVLEASFAGNPKSATVTFAVVEPDTDYVVNHVVHVTGSSNAAFIATIENKTVNGFDINLHTGNSTKVVAVDWTAHRLGS
jgi:hypothetical protein